LTWPGLTFGQDPAAFLPPPKPKPASRAWGKGTVDYSKWDAIADEDEEEERIQEILSGNEEGHHQGYPAQ